MILSGLPEKLPELCDAALVKIKCAYAAYKEYNSIAQFYHGISEQGTVYSVIGKISGYVSLWSDGSHREELKSFLDFSGFTGIFTSLKTAQEFGFKIDEQCLVFKAEPPFEQCSNSENSQPRELMEILRQGLTIPNGDEFVADITFRTLHGCADYVTENGGGALLFFSENDAIVNGIAVPKDGRSKGHGSRIMKLLLSRAKGRCVYACCTESNKPFYIKNGFSLIGEAAYCEEK